MGDIKAPLEGSGFIKAKEHLNHLVMFCDVINVEKRYDQKRKAEGEVLTVDWVCFMCHGGPNAELQLRAMISAPYIVNKIYRDGSLTLGYINQLDPKPGFEDGAIVLNAPTDVDIQRATAWWDTHKPSPVQGASRAGGSQPADPWASSPGQSTSPQPSPQNAPPASTPSPTGMDEATLKAMPTQAVHALVLQGFVTREAAIAAGHNV